MARTKKKKETVLRVTLVKSPIGYPGRQKGTVRALGLHRMNQSIDHVDSPTLRGMLRKVGHLVEIEEIED